jgi:hypothetical protein
MIETPTVLVLGAGASKPYAFPLGSELLRGLLELQNNPVYLGILSKLGFSMDSVSTFQKALHHSQLISIDKFLGNENQKQFAELGKAAIGMILLDCEKEPYNALFNGTPPDDHWYQLLWNAMATKRLSEFENNKLSVITFNYDRSLETYLTITLANTYHITRAEAFKVLARSIKFVHVYGSLGGLDSADECYVPYGDVTPEHNIVKVKESIRLMGDRTSHDIAEKCRTILIEAINICFLGFGYDEDNLDVIGAREKKFISEGVEYWTREGKLVRQRKICGSAFGLTIGQAKLVENWLGVDKYRRNSTAKYLGVNPNRNWFPNMNCSKTLKHCTVFEKI